MAKKKQRVIQHIMEDDSYQIIKRQIPNYWVVREFNKPDYGVDLVIELFEKINDEAAETLGEFIYIQVKSAKKIERNVERIYAVGNVAKGTWNENRNTYTNLEVVKYSFDTNSLYTFQTLGASVSVLLFLVDISIQEVYFICVNDYIDKILLPQNPNYTNQKSSTVTIPTYNRLSNREFSKNALEFYGKRAKFLAAFSKFYYQKNEIGHLYKVKDYPVITYRDDIEKTNFPFETEIKSQILYYISQIELLDIWNHVSWAPLPDAKEDILEIKQLLSQEKIDLSELRQKVLITWHKLSNLSNIYEEVCREYFLPKVLSLLSSYPEHPEIIDL